MPDSARITEDLVVVTPLVCFVPEKVDFFEVIFLHMSKAVSLVPPVWKDIK